MEEDDSKSSEAETAEVKPAEETEKPAEAEMMEAIEEAPAESPSEDKAPVEATDKSTEPHQALSSPQEDIQPVPILTNTNRPPSVNSTHSGASGGNAPAVLTTTSRRGGRIRSRSPAATTTRAHGDFPEGGGRDLRSHSPKNPSSAAAAAAAAAKAFSKGSGGMSKAGWGGPGHGDHPRYYEQGNVYGAPPGQGWPGAGGDGRGYGQDARHSQSIHRGRPYEPVYDDGHPRSKRRHPSDYHGPFDGQAEYDARRYGYGDSTRGGRGGAPQMRPDFFNGPAGMAPMDTPLPPPIENSAMPMSYASPMKTSGLKHDMDTPSTVKRRGGTSRVIGTPTPIHVPRAPDPPNPQLTSPKTAASVFRGRPEDTEAAKTPAGGSDEDEGRLLLSLRTPSTSFEENKAAKGPPLSPEEPPKIQHAHQQRGDQPLIFDPQRSPRSQGTNLEMAPSFTLFNHSFDSLGEAANYLGVGMPPLDSGFQSHSFGAGPTGSGDNENAAVPMLPSPIEGNASFGGVTQQILGSSSGGILTFGMSPDNSFGNGPPSSNSQRRRGNMMVLADDGRAQSPTQVLGMYPSYSGGYGPQHPGAQVPFRPKSGNGPMQPLSAGSFGPSMSMMQSYTRSFDGVPPGIYPGPMAPLRTFEHPEGALSFYPFLRRNRAAFIRCTFLLPGLKAALLETPLSETGMDVSGASDAKNSNKRNMKDQPILDAPRSFLEPKPQDTAIAMRRITSSVCAFGGSISGDRSSSSGNGSADASSIFRTKTGADGHATVTPSSSSGTPPGNRQSSRQKVKYDELLPTRYYENENRLSWEFEENPPIGGLGDDDDENDKKKRSRDGSGHHDGESSGSGSPTYPDTMKSDGPDGKHDSADQPKMRYRCKLCGLPKQNHTCPYQQSLQRSIGTMVYPAVNAFTANEPGMLAPTLTEMNNFISSGSESVSSPDNSPNRPSPGRRSTPSRSKANNVTPDSKANSPGSHAGSTVSGTPRRNLTPQSSKRKGRSGSTSNANTPERAETSKEGNAARKRPHAQITEAGDPTNDLLFVDAVELRPEQFRMVTPCKHRSGAYTYPSLPLPYAQRKRLSDNLFALSKEVPQLTDECAVVLREAREKDMWDLAVAELMTQVIIVIHCHEADTRMEGLRQYLLTLGIAC